MKLLRGLDDTSTNSNAEVKLLPHDGDDMWNLYNLISIGDIISSKTSRKVVKPAGTNGSTKAITERIVVPKLSVVVNTIDWDGTTNQIRVSGTVPNVVGGYAGDNIKRGQFHTLQLEMGENVWVGKNQWDSHSIGQLKMATSNYADVSAAALVMHMGLAHVCLITRTMCPTIAKIEVAIPKKRAVNNQQSSIDKFYNQIAQALHSLPTSSLNTFIIAAPAFIGTDFFEFMKKNYPALAHLIPITRHMHASSGHKHALLEALNDGSLGTVLDNSGLDIEHTTMKEFLSRLQTHPYQVYYGLNDVKTIIKDEPGAITTLIMLDTLFKNPSAEKREEFVNMSDIVKSNGGKVMIFSSQNPSAETLSQLTGIACILSYDVFDIGNDLDNVQLESYINTALDISPLEMPNIGVNHYTYSTNISKLIDNEGLDEFICGIDVQTGEIKPPHCCAEQGNQNNNAVKHTNTNDVSSSSSSSAVKSNKKDEKKKAEKKSEKNDKKNDKNDKNDKKGDKKSEKASKSSKKSTPEDNDLGGDDGFGADSAVVGDSFGNNAHNRDEDIGDFF